MKRCTMTGFVGDYPAMLRSDLDYEDDHPAVLARPDLFIDITVGPRSVDDLAQDIAALPPEDRAQLLALLEPRRRRARDE